MAIAGERDAELLGFPPARGRELRRRRQARPRFRRVAHRPVDHRLARRHPARPPRPDRGLPARARRQLVPAAGFGGPLYRRQVRGVSGGPELGRLGPAGESPAMSFNTFGQMFRFTTWGESHGPAIGVVVDGCPPGIPISAEMIQRDLERRKPGQSRFTTQRREDDLVNILSGVFEDERDGAAQDHRHADLDADRKHRPALQGLFRDQGQVPSRPRRFHLPAEIRHPRLQGLGPRLGARDRRARRRRRRRAAGDPQRHACAARSSRWGRTRSTTPISTGTQVDNNPFFCADPKAARRVGALSRRHPQGRQLGRRRHRGRRRRRAARLGRADLRQAQRRPRRRR